MSTRRDFLLRSGHGFGAAALASMLQGAAVNPLAPKLPPLPAKAKSVIYLFMHGGTSHVDTFDPKPELTRQSGKPISAEAAKGLKTSFIHDPSKALLRGSPWKFSHRGKSGVEVSELYQHLGEHVDDMAVIRSCYSDAFDHAPAIFLRNSGSQFPGRPCLGSWVTYGLGSENQDLPAFVALEDTYTTIRNRVWGSAFLPPIKNNSSPPSIAREMLAIFLVRVWAL